LAADQVEQIGAKVDRLPASLPTPAAMARALISVYDGVIAQLILDMDEHTVREHFVSIAMALFH
jgi:hypothetical protein